MKNVFDSYKEDIKYRIWLVFWYYKEEALQEPSVCPQLINYGYEKEEEANRVRDLLADYAEDKNFGVMSVEIP